MQITALSTVMKLVPTPIAPLFIHLHTKLYETEIVVCLAHFFFCVSRFKIKLEDNTGIRNKALNLTLKDRKRLGINKSTLWYMQKHIREGKRIKVYDKVMGKIR